MSRNSQPCIAILYGGDLGASLGRLITCKTPYRVVTTCEHRSPRTRSRVARSGIEILESLDETLRSASVILSLVLPEAALSVAQQCAERRDVLNPNSVFVDLNSIDLATVDAISRTLAEASIPFVDGAIHGGAANLEKLGVSYLSGSMAPKVCELLQPALRTVVLEGEVGQASRMKMLMAGFSKSLNLLFTEIASIAYQSDMSEPFQTEFKKFYPDIASAIERMLPTYPEHAMRRITELQNICDLGDRSGVPAEMVAAARNQLQKSAHSLHESWEEQGTMSVEDVIKLAAQAISAHSTSHTKETVHDV
jgi:3-hydroxyisobutyrate dehydrogenase-like beta-hydroxyacid dehydrogenase